MKKIILSFLLIFTSSIFIFSQNKVDSSYFKKHFYGSVRGLYVGFDDLNRTLNSEGYPGLDDELLAVEYGVFMIPKGRWASGVSGYFYENTGNVRGEGSTFSKQSFLKGWGVKSMTRFYLKHDRKLKVFGQGSVGIQWDYLKLYDNAFRIQTLSNITQNNTNVLNIKNSFKPTFDVSVGFDTSFPFGSTDFHLGTRFGYALTYLFAEWQLDGDLPVKMPDMSLGGYYFEIAFGFTVNKERYERQLNRVKARKEAREQKRLSKK